MSTNAPAARVKMAMAVVTASIGTRAWRARVQTNIQAAIAWVTNALLYACGWLYASRLQ